MSCHNKDKKAKLAKRQVLFTLSITFTIGLIAALIQICIDYRNEKNGIEQQLNQLIELSSASASESIWKLDRDFAQGVARGILSHPLVQKVNISTSNNVVMSELEQDAGASSHWSDTYTMFFGSSYTESVEVFHASDKTGTSIGFLYIQVDPTRVRRDFGDRVLIVLFSGLIKAFILGLVLFLLFYLTLTKPIQRYAQWIKQIDPKCPEGWKYKPPERKQDDELKTFGEETAQRFSLAGDYFLELQDKREKLLTLNEDLENRVSNRTRELEKSLEETKRLATTDDLTGLCNRRSFMQQSLQRHAEWLRYQRPYSLLMIDIDNFKDINDQYGHAIGDKVLRDVATVLSKNTRKENVIARLGGEEFCLLMVGIDSDQSLKLAERLRTELERTAIIVDGKSIDVTASFGLLPASLLKDSFDENLKASDAMLYLAKEQGRNRVCVFSESPEQPK